MQWFSKIAQWTAEQFGRSYAFIGAVIIVVLWLLSGPAFGWSDTWQLVINTGTTIVTFLAVFLLQHTQNRDMLALQLKLDELVMSAKDASNKFVRIEDLTESELRTWRERIGKRRPGEP